MKRQKKELSLCHGQMTKQIQMHKELCHYDSSGSKIATCHQKQHIFRWDTLLPTAKDFTTVISKNLEYKKRIFRIEYLGKRWTRGWCSRFLDMCCGSSHTLFPSTWRNSGQQWCTRGVMFQSHVESCCLNHSS